MNALHSNNNGKANDNDNNDDYHKFTNGPIKTKVINTSIFPIVFFIISLIVEVFVIIMICVVFENSLMNHLMSSVPVFIIAFVLSIVPYGAKFSFDVDNRVFALRKVAIFPLIWACKAIRKDYIEIESFALKTLRRTSNKGTLIKQLVIEMMMKGETMPVVLCSFTDDTSGDDPDSSVMRMISDMNHMLKSTTFHEELGLCTLD